MPIRKNWTRFFSESLSDRIPEKLLDTDIAMFFCTNIWSILEKTIPFCLTEFHEEQLSKFGTFVSY